MKLTKRDVDGVYRLDFGPGTAPIILSEEEMDELRITDGRRIWPEGEASE